MKRKVLGLSLLEMIIASIILALAVSVLIRIYSMQTQVGVSVDTQYETMSVDSFLSDIYDDFHSTTDIVINESSDGITITFNTDNYVNTYEYLSSEKACYKNGIEMFKCYDMKASITPTSLYVSVKISDGRILELDIGR